MSCPDMDAIVETIVQRAAGTQIAVLLRPDRSISCCPPGPRAERLAREDGAELVGTYTGTVREARVLSDLEAALARHRTRWPEKRPGVNHSAHAKPEGQRRRGQQRRDYTNERFGDLVVVGEGAPRGKHRRLVCRCVCGNEITTSLSHLHHREYPKTHCGCKGRRGKASAARSEPGPATAATAPTPTPQPAGELIADLRHLEQCFRAMQSWMADELTRVQSMIERLDGGA